MAEYGFITTIHNDDAGPVVEHLLVQHYLGVFRDRNPDAEVVDTELTVGAENSGRLPGTRAVGFLIEYVQ